MSCSPSLTRHMAHKPTLSLTQQTRLVVERCSWQPSWMTFWQAAGKAIEWSPDKKFYKSSSTAIMHAGAPFIYFSLPKEQGYWGINVTQANTWVDKKLHFQHLMSVINAPQVGGVLRNRLREATKIWMCCRFSIRDMQQARIHDDETPDYAIRTNFPHLRRLLQSQGDIKSWLIQLCKTWNHPYDSRNGINQKIWWLLLLCVLRDSKVFPVKFPAYWRFAELKQCWPIKSWHSDEWDLFCKGVLWEEKPFINYTPLYHRFYVHT